MPIEHTDLLNTGIFSLIALGLFFVIGLQARMVTRTAEDFWFSHFSMTGSNLSFTWAVSFVSFGIGLFYFMSLVPLYGYWVLLGSMLSYFIGNWIVARFVDRDQVVQLQRDKYTIGAYIENVTKSVRLGRLIDMSNVLAYFGMLLAEVFLSVGLLSFWFPESAFQAEIWAAVAFCAIILCYMAMGGFRAIVASDRWQAYLLILGTLAFVVAAGVFVGEAEGDVRFSLAPAASTSEIFFYVLFAFVVNINYVVPQIASWQRVSATQHSQRKGGLWVGIALIFGFYLVYIFCSALLNSNGHPIEDVSDVFTPVLGIGRVGITILLPLVFVGFVSSVLSTADTAALSAALSLLGRRLALQHQVERQSEAVKTALPRSRGSRRTEFQADTSPRQSRVDEEFRRERSAAMKVIAAMLTLIIFMFLWYKLSGSDFRNVYLQIVFFFVSQVIVGGPIMMAILSGRTRLTKERVLFWSGSSAWLLIIGGSLIGLMLGVREITFLSTLIGAAVVAFASFLSLERPETRDEGVKSG